VVALIASLGYTVCFVSGTVLVLIDFYVRCVPFFFYYSLVVYCEFSFQFLYFVFSVLDFFLLSFPVFLFLNFIIFFLIFFSFSVHPIHWTDASYSSFIGAIVSWFSFYVFFMFNCCDYRLLAWFFLSFVLLFLMSIKKWIALFMDWFRFFLPCLFLR